MKGQQDRQCVDALGQILARQLPQFLLGADDIEDVVAQLEQHPEAAAERGEGINLGTWEISGESSDAA